MLGRGSFERGKNKKTPDSNLMIGLAEVDGGAVFMWNIAGTCAICQERG